jgi:hypothetical protein
MGHRFPVKLASYEQEHSLFTQSTDIKHSGHKKRLFAPQFSSKKEECTVGSGYTD